MPQGEYPERPHLIYKIIFQEDPLLLNDFSLRVYAKSLLRHTLVFRSAIAEKTGTDDPPDMNGLDPDLFDADRVAELYRRYSASISKRTRLWLEPKDEAFLRKVTMKSDGGRTNNRLTPSIPKVSVTDEATGDIRIAAVGYRVKMARTESPHFEECLGPLNITEGSPILDGEAVTYGLAGRTQVLDREKRLRSWWQEIQKLLHLSLESNADIVFFPEFALPPDETSSDGNGALTAEEVFKSAVRDDGKDDCLVFSGTRHEGLYNRGLVLQKETGNVGSASWHYKIASARNLRENIITDSDHKIKKYKLKYELKSKVNVNSGDPDQYAEILIPICYDTFDPSIFQSYLHAALRGEDDTIRIFLVPSFNPSQDFIALLRDLSFLTQSVIVYLDALHGDSYMFICGFDMHDFAYQNRRETLIKSVANRCESLSAQLKEIKRCSELANRLGKHFTADEVSHHKKIRRQETVIRDLHGKLERHAASGTFENIVKTFKSRTGLPSSEVKISLEDVLIYDLDLGFVHDLMEFRERYFEAEEYLPSSILRKRNRSSGDDVRPVTQPEDPLAPLG